MDLYPERDGNALVGVFWAVVIYAGAGTLSVLALFLYRVIVHA